MMRKIPLLFIFLLFIFLAIPLHRTAFAAGPCNFNFTDENGNPRGKTFFESDKQINYTIKVKDPSMYTVRLCQAISCVDLKKFTDPTTTVLTGRIPFFDTVNSIQNAIKDTLQKGIPIPLPIDKLNSYRFEVIDDQSAVGNPICTNEMEVTTAPTPTPVQRADCVLSLKPINNITKNTPLTIEGVITTFYGINENDYSLMWQNLGYLAASLKVNVFGMGQNVSFTPKGTDRYTFRADILKWREGTYHVKAQIYISNWPSLLPSIIPVSCSLDFKVPGGVITPTPIPPTPTIPAICNSLEARDEKSCDGDYAECPWCNPENNPNIKLPKLQPLCNQIASPNDPDPQKQRMFADCDKCVRVEGGIWSAIGCLPTNFSALLGKYVFKYGVGIAGSIAFLYFIYGAFVILTSAGNAEKMEEAKQIITSSLAGLLLIIFSIFLLKVIGVDILQLPGFGS